jgi:photosystem II stability/assembly factor-like uncharacterized protein
MKRFCLYVVIFTCLFLLCILAVAQSPSRAGWVLLGPEGGDARSLAYDPRDPARLFLGTSAGELYLSTDNGARWARFAHLGAGNDYVLDNIAIDPRDSKTLYVAAWSVESVSGDLFRSRDGGRTWEALPGMRGKSIRAMSLAPSDPNTIVVGALDGVFRSRDAGQSWERISPANHAEIKNIESIAVDPANPDVIYAGTWHLPWKTENGGGEWHSIKNGIIDDSDVFSIIIDPTIPKVVYVSACSGIYKSYDAGDSFRKIQGIPDTARRTRVLQLDPSNSNIVYAGTTEGLFKTVNAGYTWHRMGPANWIVNDVMVDPRRPTRVLLATDRSGVLASEDGGQTAVASNRGFSHRQVSAVVAAPSGDAIYAGVVNDKEFGGVFSSTDNGAHWQQMNTGLSGDDIFALALADSGELLAGTNRGLYIFDRAASAWHISNLVLAERTTSVVRRVGKKEKIVTKHDFVKSDLRGPVAQVVATPKRWIAAAQSGLYISLDRGASWHGGTVLGENVFVGVSVLDDRIAAAAPASLLTSNDGGTVWSILKLPSYVTRLFGVSLEPERVWITSREGAFFSNDAGQTWEHVLVGSPAMQVVSVAYDAANHRTLGVASNGEIYSTTTGKAWSRTAEPGRALRSLSIAGNRIYGITQFSGIVAAEDAAITERAAAGSGAQQ